MSPHFWRHFAHAPPVLVLRRGPDRFGPMTATRSFLLARLREGLDALGPFPAGIEHLTEAETARLLLEEAMGHNMRLMEWHITTVGSAKEEFVDLQTKTIHLMNAIEKATYCKWKPLILKAIRKAGDSLENLSIQLAPVIQALEAQPANAHFRVPNSTHPCIALHFRAEVVLNLAGKPTDNPRGKGSYRSLVNALHALGTGKKAKDYGTWGAQALLKLKEAQPHLFSLAQKETSDRLVAVRKRTEERSPLVSFQLDQVGKEWQEQVQCLESLLTDYYSVANP